MAEVSITTNAAMEDAPSCDNKGGMDGRVKEGAPDTGEGSTDVRVRDGTTEGHAVGAGGAGGAGLQVKPRGGGVEDDRIIAAVHGRSN